MKALKKCPSHVVTNEDCAVCEIARLRRIVDAMAREIATTWTVDNPGDPSFTVTEVIEQYESDTK